MDDRADQIARDFISRYEAEWSNGAEAVSRLYAADGVLVGFVTAVGRSQICELLRGRHAAIAHKSHFSLLTSVQACHHCSPAMDLRQISRRHNYQRFSNAHRGVFHIMNSRKRVWTTRKGEQKTAWVVDYRDQGGKRHIETFDRKKDAEAREATVRSTSGGAPRRAERQHHRDGSGGAMARPRRSGRTRTRYAEAVRRARAHPHRAAHRQDQAGEADARHGGQLPRRGAAGLLDARDRTKNSGQFENL